MLHIPWEEKGGVINGESGAFNSFLDPRFPISVFEDKFYGMTSYPVREVFSTSDIFPSSRYFLPHHQHPRDSRRDQSSIDEQPRPGPFEGELRPEDAGVGAHGDPRALLPAHPELRRVEAEQDL